jgi:HlyD family secretion protein
VRFSGEQPEGLRQSQRLSVRVLIDQRSDVLTVERGSFADQGGGYAWRVDGDVALKVPVRLGAASISRWSSRRAEGRRSRHCFRRPSRSATPNA